jgi:transposase
VDIPATKEDVPMAEKRRQYTEEFKTEAVRLLKGGERTLAQIAREIGVSETTLWGWAYRGKRARAKGEVERQTEGGALRMSEREELRKLRRENAVLREEREILKKATAFFAKENK